MTIFSLITFVEIILKEYIMCFNNISRLFSKSVQVPFQKIFREKYYVCITFSSLYKVLVECA